MNEATSWPAGLASLLEALIDYAGLFPPAGLDMAGAVERYARYRASADRRALGRFVVPVARLEEFEAAADVASRAQRGDAWATWRLAVLATLPLDADLARIAEFNTAHGAAAGGWPAQIDAVEVAAASATEIARAAACAPPALDLFFEVPWQGPFDDLCAAAAAGGRGLKIRTGGTRVDAFPPSSLVARFLAACATAGVPFKATAGLHHPLRASHPVTYAPGAPTAVMHGFLNVFTAAALLLTGRVEAAGATRVLEDQLPGSFRFEGDALAWREHRLSADEVAAARRIARSFGSCSFEEPVTELRELVETASLRGIPGTL